MSEANTSRYAMTDTETIMEASDLGIVNGHLTLNGWSHDLAAIRGLFAPPLFSNNFVLNIRFDGRRIPARHFCWNPTEITRQSVLGDWKFQSELVLAAGMRAAVMRIEVENRAASARTLQVQYEISGGLGRQPHWGFSRPDGAEPTQPSWHDDVLRLSAGGDCIAVASSLQLTPSVPVTGILDAEQLQIAPRAKVVFYTFVAIDATPVASANLARLRREPAAAIRRARDEWQRRVETLETAMPRFSSDCDGLVRLYDRSLLHLLLNEWNVPEFFTQPYYSTGGINGGCTCCYLWNYGEPYRLWSMLNPAAAREYLKAFLQLDLCDCYALYPDDGTRLGPYYPVNQEKVIFLAHAYVLQTGDTAFLHEKLGNESIIGHIVQQALAHDDLNQPAVLVDYGNGNHHLELRREYRYDGIIPDMNLRRCVCFHLADELCRVAGYDPHIDLCRRAADLKKLIRDELFDVRAGWFRHIDSERGAGLCYTMQMFKALGWGDWALDPEAEAALVAHINEEEFLGQYGFHSLSKLDPAYDQNDVDNGGPGACISFAPAITDRLYRSGRRELAERVFLRLLWLGECLPYWGDSQTANMQEYRRDTPLQNDIQGAALAQTIIFGMFGIRIGSDFTIEISPSLPQQAKEMQLENIRLLGLTFAIRVTGSGYTVILPGREITASPGEVTRIEPAAERVPD